MITIPLKSTDMATVFKALGDPTRLRIFEFLRGCSGPVAVDDNGDVRPVVGETVGEICCQVTGRDEITSAISFHLKELRLAGLITVERRGKNMLYSIDEASVEALASYFGGKTDPSNTKCC